MPYNQRESNPFYKHGLSANPLYRVWASMLDRCRNPKNDRWHRYGGRGITVCERWLKFENFYEDMAPRPPNTTLDRKRNNEGYSQDNCKWSTQAEQARNRSDNHMVEHNGETHHKAEWARRLGLTFNTFNYRYRKGTLQWPV